MNGDIRFDVIGNTSAFSMMGESSGYMLTVNDCCYLLECGSPIFPSLGFRGIAEIRGIFTSHSHEDHKRWFTDIVQFSYYRLGNRRKLRLISAEPVLEEYAKNSKGALERSLSRDSKRIVDIPYESMVEEVQIGPRSKYFINLKSNHDGTFKYEVSDRRGNTIGPEKAKIIINPGANRPRLLFKDDESGEWVEPESYYPFSSNTFYEEDRNVYYDEKAGLTVRAIKASVWHGVPSIGFKFTTETNSLFFSGDTVYKPSLWKQLCEEHRPQKFRTIGREDFEGSSVIYGEINDFIERTWSRERYEVAVSAYEGSVVIHDVTTRNSAVHTVYKDIATAPINNLLYTHNPDNITAWRPILSPGKSLFLRDGNVYESVKGTLYSFDADVYIHHFSGDLVGYRSENGAYKVIEKNGLLGVVDVDHPEKGLIRVDLYQDVEGEYFPHLINDPNKYYCVRQDGKVEEVTFDESSSVGRVIESIRDRVGGQ
jgi:ribonuclease BN (tRNA processing enzyme)